jgi:cytosine/adenosine deaminase-related metal-dependent hydrolase
MRKITANYIFPVSSAPLKNGIIVLDEENRITDIIDTKNNFKEIANLEFYGGVIVPAFVDAFTLISYATFSQADFTDCLEGDFNKNLQSKLSRLDPDLKSVQRSINHLEAFGTKATLDAFPNEESAAQKERSKVHFTQEQELKYRIPGQQEQMDSSIALINSSILSKLPTLPKQSQDICIGTGSLGTHQKLSVFDEMKLIQNHFPELSVWEMITWGTLQTAQKLHIDDDFGSLEIGKQPGLNLISGIDFESNKLKADAELKVLI